MNNSSEDTQLVTYNGVITAGFQDPTVNSMAGLIILERHGHIATIAERLAKRYSSHAFSDSHPPSYLIAGVVVTPGQIRWNHADSTSLEGGDFSRADSLLLQGNDRSSLEAVAALLDLPAIEEMHFR